MTRNGIWLCLPLFLAPGCTWLSPRQDQPPPPCSYYHAANFSAAMGQRVLLMPLANDSPFPQAPERVGIALAAELQTVGQVEVVLAPCDCDDCLSQVVHTQGSFNETAVLAMAHALHVDTVLTGDITQYQPYAPQRLGLSLRLISPAAGTIIASLDGLWDVRDKNICALFRCTENPDCERCVRMKSDLIVTAPRLFHRVVCHQAVEVLLTPPRQPGEAGMPGNSPAVAAPPEVSAAGPPLPPNTMISPVETPTELLPAPTPAPPGGAKNP
jgi:hypothetical protein